MPVLVLSVVVLAVSIIGIPLLVLVPFAILGFLLAVLIGFTGVVLRLGRWAAGTERPAFVTLAVGVVIVAAVGLLARYDRTDSGAALADYLVPRCHRLLCRVMSRGPWGSARRS